MRRIQTATVFTHRRTAETEPALMMLIEMAHESGVTLRFDPEETAKHNLPDDPFVERDSSGADRVDLCFALGGDGTILSALRRYAGTGVPVFGINFGEMGFLATVDREEAWAGSLRALAGDFEVLSLPGIEVSGAGMRALAINDVSIHRQPGKRVADLEYSVGNDEVGRVRCDGLVVSTPAGSTGYNLANGGPVMAWGVHGYVVSFISPHSLTARTLVVAPADRLTIDNRSREEPVDVTVDGRPIGVLEAGERLEARFVMDQGSLAQVPGTTFYQRLRQKFGRLATPL
ncbi:MAG TPA: NAD(+)/NADH kinase [Solirubrobacteraceae bacterium]|nr:NAD(+)/NADH kinase [Solirubrobacteraceae bacterium]